MSHKLLLIFHPYPAKTVWFGLSRQVNLRRQKSIKPVKCSVSPHNQDVESLANVEEAKDSWIKRIQATVGSTWFYIDDIHRIKRNDDVVMCVNITVCTLRWYGFSLLRPAGEIPRQHHTKLECVGKENLYNCRTIRDPGNDGGKCSKVYPPTGSAF